MTATQQYIDILTRLQSGELALLRTHVGQELDASVDGFDLFTGLWWPLRQQSARAPRREVAWLIAKLYACSPLPQVTDATLARQLRRCQPVDARTQERFQQRFDRMLLQPVRDIEPALRWALDQLAARRLPLDWVRLTDDLSLGTRIHPPDLGGTISW